MKTKEDERFDDLLIEYRQTFNKSYGIVGGDHRPLSYHIKAMEEALKTGKPVEVFVPKHPY